MAEHLQTLPPLEWIRVFEAAARLGSFTAAARELGLTQAAVSQRIRNLELRLGAPLFSRQPRGVLLSIQGEAWLPQVQAALDQLLHSTANLFELPRRKITIAAASSVIELWMVPRLRRIAQRLPEVQLSFETIHHRSDFDRSDADFEIRFGAGTWPGRDARRLFAERLGPVASPSAAAAGHWPALPRIATTGPRDGWRDWSERTGSPAGAAPVLRFDTFVQALRAAEAGAGVLLGSLPLCQAALRAGSLVCLDDRTLDMEAGYWITWLRQRPSFAERAVLIETVTTL